MPRGIPNSLLRLTDEERALRIFVKRRANSARYISSPKGRRTRQQCNHVRNYGITLEEKEAMLAGQGHVCKLCGGSEPGSKRGWQTDHCHKTGKIRGVLCQPCNTQLGLYEKNPAFGAAAAKYLEAFGASDV